MPAIGHRTVEFQCALFGLAAVGILLAGCSSSGHTTPPASGGTAGANGSAQHSQKNDDNGGFNTAGRISGHFQGTPSQVFLTLSNPASEPYTGTVTITDCTNGEGGVWVTASPHPVTVPARNGTVDGEVPVEAHVGDSQESAGHVMCARLTGSTTEIKGSLGGASASSSSAGGKSASPSASPHSKSPNPSPSH